MESSRLPLAGVKVIELCLARAGPTTVRHLSDWGADVIKVEPLEASAEDVTGKRDGFDFQNLHRNKRTIRLNLKTPEGHAAFMKLVQQADVLVENMRATVKYRLKVAWEDVKKVNPRLVYGSLSGFGQTGPYSTRGGVDQIAQGMSGPGSGARRHRGGRHDCRQPARHGDFHGTVRSRALRRRTLGHHQPAGIADLHARLPGHALADQA